MNREIPFIEDELVDPAFGTGVVKLLRRMIRRLRNGQRHNLPQIEVIAKMRRSRSRRPVQSLDRNEARKRVVEDLEAQGFLVRTEPFTHNVGHCQRCNTIV